MREIASLALNEDLAERIRVILARTGSLREVRMFGGLCFMLNGNMVAGTSKRGLLVRVGKGQHARASPNASKPTSMGVGHLGADGDVHVG
jgi:TfoX/Sxy family transcriptional regulator of competence genes